MKKIIVGLLSAVVLFTAQSAFAAVTWNTMSNDCKSMSVANATTYEGYQNPCWPLTSVSADAGDVINVRIYYHNTSSQTATNTRIVLSPSTGGASTTKSFTGRIVSDQGTIDIGPVMVHLSSAQTVTFDSVKWYTNNTSETYTPLPNGQTGREMLTDNGLNIGSVAAGWASQGSFAVAFRVSNTTPVQLCQDPTATNYGGPAPCTFPVVHNCTISNFSASPSAITAGGSSTLSWTTANCTSASISGIGNVSVSSSQPVYPGSTTTYTLTAHGSNGSTDTRSATVTVNQPSVTSGNITANPSSCTIASGASSCSTTLSWSTVNPVGTSAVTNPVVGTVANANSGTKQTSVSYGSQTYFLYNNGKLLDQASVTASCASGTSWNGSNCATVVVNNCTINSFTANPTSVTAGGSSTLTWNTTNCSSVSISSLAMVPTSGSQTVYPTATTTYVLTAHGNNGSTDTQSVTVVVTQPSNPSGNITANPTACTIPSGASSCTTVLSWSTVNPVGTSAVTSAVGTIANGNSGSKQTAVTNGTQTFFLYNNSQLLDQVSVVGSCASGSSWNGSNCATVVVNNCTINSFTANPTSITRGDGATLSWNTNNCVSASISGLGSVSVNGSQTVYPTTTTTYVLTAIGSNGVQQSQSVSVSVGSVAAPSGTLTSSAPSCVIASGDSTCAVRLSWNTINPIGVSEVTRDGSGTVAKANSGTGTALIEFPSSSFRLYNNSVELAHKTVTASCASGNTWDGSKCAPKQTESKDCIINSFTANPNSVVSGSPVTLTWNTVNCISANITTLGNVQLSGSQTVYPTVTTTYVLTTTGNNWIQQSQSVTVTVIPFQNNNCTISNFTANPNSVSSGNPVNLTWNTNNCVSATVSGQGINNNSLNGSQTIYPTSSSTYTLTAYGASGAAQTQTVFVSVNSVQNNCYISNFIANPTSVTSGNPVTLTWNTVGCSSVTITGLGSVGLSGSQQVYPTYTTNYVLTAYGQNGGQQTQTVYVTVNPVYTPPVVNDCAVTTVATNVTRNSAQLNGVITGSNGSSATYFEYGPTIAFGQQTPTQYASNGAFTQFLTGLAPNTIYYFRLVSTCSNGSISQGATQFFSTLGNPVVIGGGGTTTVRPVIVQGTTVIGTSSPIMLSITNRYEAIGVGDTIDYTVNYKNIGSALLTRPILQVVAPKGIVLTNASRGTYSADTNTLTVQLEDLYPNAEGVVFIQGRVDAVPANTAQIVTTAILVYTTPNGAQENAIAYVLNKPKELFNNNLGAAAFFAGIFPGTLLGWLLLLILILLIILLARRFYARPVVVASHMTVPPPQAH